MSVKASRSTLALAAFLAFATTAAYCLAAGFLSAFWSMLVTDQVNISRLSVYTIKPITASTDTGMLHWFSAALISLGCNAIWVFRRSAHFDAGCAIALPFCCHLSWLMLAMFLHIGGGLASLVKVTFSIS